MTRAAALVAGVALLAPAALAQVSAEGEAQVGIGVRTNTATGTGRGPIGPWEAGSMRQPAPGGEDRREGRDGERQGPEVRTRVDAMLKTRVETFSTRVFDRVSAALERLEAFDAKVEARIAELSARGVDTARASAELAEARAIRAQAEADVAALEARFSAALGGETSRQELTAMLRDARQELRDARLAYAEVLIALRTSVRAANDAR